VFERMQLASCLRPGVTCILLEKDPDTHMVYLTGIALLSLFLVEASVTPNCLLLLRCVVVWVDDWGCVCVRICAGVYACAHEYVDAGLV